MSAAVVLLSGVLLIANATAPIVPEFRSMWVALVGTVVGLIGLVVWLTAFLGDRGRDRA